MASRYAKIIKTLPKFVGKDAQSQRIAATAEAIKREPDFVQQASSLAAIYTKLRAMRKILDHVESSLELRTQAIELITLEQFENEATLSIKLAEGTVSFDEALADLIDEILSVKEMEVQINLTPTVYYQPEISGIVKDKALFRQWCIDNGLGDELQLWPSTMQKITRERLAAGDSAPDGVEATSKAKLTF